MNKPGPSRPDTRKGTLIRKDKTHGKEVDCQVILEMLANGGASDLEIEESDEESGEEHAIQTVDTDDINVNSDNEAQNDENIEIHDTPVAQQKQRITWKSNTPYNAPSSKFKGKDQEFLYDELPSPFSLFTTCYPDSFFEDVVNYTNTYSMQKFGKELNTNIIEIKQLFGIHIAFGALGFPQQSMYWASTTKIPMIADTMSRNRFFKLRNCLHMVDVSQSSDRNTLNENNVRRENDQANKTNSPTVCKNSSADKEVSGVSDKLWKFRPIIKRFQNQCRELPIQENMCIDEQMIPFKGHVSFRQYIKSKPNPWGIKVFVLCSESGLVIDLIVYQGQTTEYRAGLLKNFGLGAGTILHLAEIIPEGLNYKLYYDNYFNSIPLLLELSKKGIQAAGTINKNRLQGCPIPQEKNQRKEGRGTSKEINGKDKICIVSWYDNKCVLMASNFVGNGNMDIAERWDKKRNAYVDVTRPEVIKRYNSSMGGLTWLTEGVLLR